MQRAIAQIRCYREEKFSSSQELRRILRNPKFHYHNQKSSSPISILSQFDAVHIPSS